MWVIALTLLAAAGCQQGVYRASSLPPELAAAAIPHVNSFDLTRLGAAPVNSELVYPTDALKVTVSTGIEDTEPPASELMVSRDGTSAVPVIGTVHVAGLSLAEAAEAIRQEGMRRDIYRDPTVALAFGVRAMNRITVDGAVEKPGTYELPAGSSNHSTLHWTDFR
jgi:polysaccharide export outer membrane protein